ncbi:MAG: hypothetical protein V8R80_11605 [Eubacterium sp.]
MQMGLEFTVIPSKGEGDHYPDRAVGGGNGTCRTKGQGSGGSIR